MRQGVQEQGLDLFVTDNPARIGEAGLNILTLEPRVAVENRLDTVSRGQHRQDVLHREAPAAH